MDMNALEEVRQEVLAQLREKYGDDKVQQVDDLGENTTLRMLNGEDVEGVESWMYDVVQDFQTMLLFHPRVKVTQH